MHTTQEWLGWLQAEDMPAAPSIDVTRADLLGSAAERDVARRAPGVVA